MNEIRTFIGFTAGLALGLVLLAAIIFLDARREARYPAPVVQPCGPDGRPCPCGPKCPTPRKGDLGDVTK